MQLAYRQLELEFVMIYKPICSMEKRLKQLLNYGINCKHEILLTLIWVGFLGVCFEVAGGGKGKITTPV